MTLDAIVNFSLACVLVGLGGAFGSGLHHWAFARGKWRLADLGLWLTLALPCAAIALFYSWKLSS